MDEALIEYWTPEEGAAGICTPSEVGKVKGKQVEARRLAQAATIKAVKALVEVTEQNEDLGAKVKAAQMILDRGWGKPDQHSSQEVNVFQFPEMPWLTARRLSYQEASEVAPDILLTHASPQALASPSASDSAESVLPRPAEK
ncbi:MAG: hypothetical protein EON54_28960 [Alcaligenaceae bacterium]|nr:MAG: hypothetical protein EON54_28960 [Alcaligenaceae bacterium]